MAETIKNYLDLPGLAKYDEKIKDKIAVDDAVILEAAKKYHDDNSDFDPIGTAQTKVDALANGQVKANKEAIDKINHATTGILAQAKTYADGKDTAIADAKKAGTDAQTAVNTLSGKVGTVPDSQTVMGIIQNIQESVYDDTEIKNLIKTNADDIDSLEGRATTVEGKVTTLIGTDTGKSARTIANEELAKQLIPAGAKESLDTLAEIAAWIQNHPDDVSAINLAISKLQTLVGTIPDGVTATTIVGMINEVVQTEKTRAEGAENALDGRLDTVESNIGTGTVDSRIATAKNEAISSAKGYTDTEIGKVKTAVIGADTDLATADTVKGAKKYADSLNTTMDGRVEVLETASGNVPTQISNAINALDADVTSTTVETGKGVQVQIVEADGKINSVKVSGNYDNMYDAKGASSTAQTNANAYTDAEIAKIQPISEADILKLFA